MLGSVGRGRVIRWIVVATVVGLVASMAPGSAGAAPASAGESCQRIWHRTGSGFYESNPTYIDPHDDTASWRFSTPRAQGLDAAILDAGVAGLSRDPSLFSVLIVRHGRLVYERYFHGSARDQSNNVHSASKSILESLVALAVRLGAIGSLDDPVSRYLPQDFVGASDAKQAITIRQLMTMTSGLKWREDHTEYTTIQHSADWVRAILAERLRRTPGTTFHYSTGNTHVVSAVIQAATGMSTCAFARRYLFDPIGIAPEHWGRDPQGIYSGGYNLYLTPREMAKFGLLYLNGGVWHGRRVLPRAAIRLARTRTSQVDPTFSYATGWWMRTILGHPMYFAWGYGGQFIYAIPDLDIVFVTSENTADGQRIHEINSGRFIERYLIPSVMRP
jgi:CubicO group peptidase (beta-lactamase class C family)